MTARVGHIDRNVAVQLTLIGAMVAWGLNVSIVKTLTASFDPLHLAAIRMVIATVVFSGILVWRRCGIPKITLRQSVPVIGCAVLMVYANQILFAEGLLRSTATNGSLIMALSPLVSAILAAMIFREAMTIVRIAGVVLGFGGVAAVVLSHPGAAISTASVGDAMLVASVVSFAAGGVLVQRLARQFHPLSISWAIYLLGTAMLVVHALLVPASSPSRGWVVPSAWQATLLLTSGVAATALGNLVWNQAIASIGVARTAVFLYWVPVFGVGFAALLLGDHLTWWHLFGFVAVMSGTWLGTRPTGALTHVTSDRTRPSESHACPATSRTPCV